MLPYLNCTGDEVHKQTDLNKMWAKKHKQTKVILGGWRNPTLGQSQQGIKTKLLRVLLGTLLDFSLKLLLNTSLIWIISGISLLTKWKVVLWQNLKYTSNFFFNFPKIHNFLRNWISNFDSSFKQHILHKHIFKTQHFFGTWSNTKTYYPVPLSMGFSRQEY